MKLCGLLYLFLLMPLWGGEVAVLLSGFRIRAERIEIAGAIVRLHTRTGVIEFDSAQVTAIEREENVPAPAVPETAPARTVAEPAAAPKSVRELVTDAALKHGLPPEFVHSVAQAESAYRQDARSSKGAVGVMQLMPGTAQALGADPHNVEENVEAGTRYLRDLLVKYENDPNPVRRALAAYNAGPGAVDRYKGVPPYRETRQYVERVIERYWKQVNAPASAPGPGANPERP